MTLLSAVVVCDGCALILDYGSPAQIRSEAGPDLPNADVSEASSRADAKADRTLPEGSVTWRDNRHAYHLVVRSSKISWESARDEAIVLGGYLAVLTSSAENEFVFRALVVERPDAFTGDFGPWLGGKQDPQASVSNSGWRWVTGEPWAYTAWAPNEPNDFSPGEDSLFFYSPGGATNRQPLWNDGLPTLATSSYIVEFE